LHDFFYFQKQTAYKNQMKEKTDNELMALVVRHDEKALSELIERYRGRLQRFAYGLLSDKAAADDAIQETFIRLWTRAHRYDGRYNVSTWLYTICSRRCYDEMRHHRKMLSAIQLPEVVVQADSMEASELAELLKSVVASLPIKQRLIYQLREVEGLSTDDTAVAVKMSHEQVKANLWAARNAVREKLKQYGIQ